jgi:hypothetical protein
MQSPKKSGSGDKLSLSPRERAGVRGKRIPLSNTWPNVFSLISLPLIPTFSLREKEVIFPALVSNVHLGQTRTPVHGLHRWTAAVCPKHQPQHVRVLRGLLNFHALRLVPLTRNTAAVLKTHFPLPTYA